MKNILINNIKNALEDQKNIFGNDLLCTGIDLNINVNNINTMSNKITDSQSNSFINDEEAKVIKIKLEQIKKKNTPRAKKDTNEVLFSNLSISDFEDIKSIDDFGKHVCNCQNCVLGTTRTNFVFGEGNPNADVMLVGEGPGADEDAQGRPFVGRAGQLLDKIMAAIHFKRDELYIANIVKCRPPGNRVPTPEEANACYPYLLKQIDLVKPKVILCLGLTAATYILNKKETLRNFRGKLWDFQDIKVVVTYHPAALLRNENYKIDTWKDVRFLREYYDKKIMNQPYIFEKK